MSRIFSGAKLIVVKVGSALLVDGAKGELRREWLASLCDDVAALKKDGAAVVLVSSGSIALSPSPFRAFHAHAAFAVISGSPS